MYHSIRNSLVGLTTALMLAAGVADANAANRVFLGNADHIPLTARTDPDTVNTLNTLRHQAVSKGTTRIIVGVRAAFAPEGEMDAAGVAQQRSEIASMHAAVLKKIPSLKARPEKAKQFETIPFMALEVDAAELEALAGQAEITSIEEDRLASPTLAESVPLIGGTTAWSMGYTGAGQTVAILDTGVDKTHPFLTGKVVAEACYSTNDAVVNASSVCPDGVTQSTAVGSAMPYAGACPAGECDHGTHVAGIAAGKGASFSGVAKDASVIAIQVFTRLDGISNCGSTTPCIGAFTSDIILGLERVYALRSTYNIAAVNMSLGGSAYSYQPSCDADNLPTKTAIDNLRSANIATAIAAGNNGYYGAISEPGCISTAISVGATTKADVVDYYSNSASFLNLLAPGSSINSSIPGGGYAIYSGTSMATPHVTGAWAILKQQNPNLTVIDALNALSSTGIPITDARNGIVKPRIQIDAALNFSPNTLPSLSYSSETGYGTDGVNPNSGTASTQFTFKVVYADASNIAPSSIHVCVDGTCNAMSRDTGAIAFSLRDNSYTNGEQYVYTATLAAGLHSYYFDASHGAAPVTLPASGTLSDPTVSNLTISTPTTLPNGIIGTAYSAALAANGGTTPYTWSTSGLPAGLSINSSTGAISGTPTTAGIYGLTAIATDATGAAFSKVFTIVIQDGAPPTVPTGLTARAASTTWVNLSWIASTDNIGVTEYKIYRNGVQIGTPAGTNFIDTGLTRATTYNYTVAACDVAASCSVQSTTVSATTLAAPTSGAVAAWGHNNSGQTTVPIGLSGVVAIAAGDSHTVALKNDGTVVAWGDNSAGQTAVPTGLSEITAIAAGAYHTVAIALPDTTAPTVPIGLTVSTVGVTSTTQLMLSWTASTDIGWAGVRWYQVYRNGVQVGTPAGTNFTDNGLTRATTYNYTVAACDAAINCSAQSTSVSATTLPSDTIAPTVPVGIAATPASATQVNLRWTASTDNVYATVYQVYRNGVKVGVPAGTIFIDTGLKGATAYSYTVAACDAAGNCSAQSLPVSATTLAAVTPGLVAAWGYNYDGQTTVPVGLSGVVAISAGNFHTMALNNDGTVVAWGDNSFGQTTVPTGLSGVTAISAGGWHNAALKSDGTVVAWGHNGSGRTDVPVGLSGVVAIAAGQYHTVALKNDGTVVAWGRNLEGQTTMPADLNGVTAIAAGIFHTVALKNDGTVVAWGDNSQGQTTVPAGLSGVVAIAAGAYHTMALKNDGTVVAWGWNNYGQTTVPAGLSGVTVISGGWGHTVVLFSTVPDTTSPTVPTGLTASAISTSQVNLSWTASTDNIGVTGYKVYRDGVQVGAPTGTSFNDTGLASATTYSYTIAACDVSGNCSALSAPATATTLAADTTPPVVTASVAGGTYNSTQYVALSANEPATIYYTINGTTPTVSSPVYATPISISTTTTLKYFGRDTAGNSSLMQKQKYLIDTVAPAVPTGLIATPVSSSKINLSWVASTDNVGVTAYKVYRGGVLIATLGNVTSYSNTGLTALTSYSYTVAACDAAGNCSAQSTAVVAKTLAVDTVAPSVPTGLIATPVSSSQINLTWIASTDNIGVAKYKVYRGGVLIAALGNVTSYNNTGLTALPSYSYTVAACDAAGNCSAQSTAAVAKTL